MIISVLISIIITIILLIITAIIDNKIISNIFLVLSSSVFVISMFIIITYPYTKLPNIDKLENYEEEILILQAKQNNIKDKDLKEYEENEEKIKKLYEKYNKDATRYNRIIEKDEEKLFIFRWYPDEEKIKLYN